MSENANAVKQSLLRAAWKKMGEIDVEGEGGTVKLVIRRPPPKANIKLLALMKAEGLVDAKGEPSSPEAAVEMAARMFAPMIFLPGEREPLFTPEELAEAPWFNEAADACKDALGIRASVEAAKGN